MFRSLIIVNTYDYAFRKSHLISVVSCFIEHCYTCIYLLDCTPFKLRLNRPFIFVYTYIFKCKLSQIKFSKYGHLVSACIL